MIENNVTLSLDDYILELVEEFSEVLKNNMKKRLKCFAEQQVQLEGWLKGELLFFLENKKINFYREKCIDDNSRKKIDLLIESKNRKAYIELKYGLIGEQGNQKYKVNFYFYKSSIENDLKKLYAVEEGKKKIERYMLFLFVEKSQRIESVIKNFNSRGVKLNFLEEKKKNPKEAKLKVLNKFFDKTEEDLFSLVLMKLV